MCAFETRCVEDLVFGAVDASGAVVEGLSGRALLAGVGLVLILVGGNTGDPQPVSERIGLVLDHVAFHQHVIIGCAGWTVGAYFGIGVEELVFGAGDALLAAEIRHSLRTLLSSDLALL